MNYLKIDTEDVCNGNGLRAVLWLSGCSHHCKGCQNPLTWNPDNGLDFDDSAKQEIFKELDESYISGITFSGGDPLYEGNREDVLNLMKEIKEKYPNKTIWCYTGFTLTELEEQTPDFAKELKDTIDVLVEGRYVEELRNVNLHWVGSSNQNVIYFNKENVEMEIV